MSHKAEAVTGMKAATESTVAKKSEDEKKLEKEKQKAELEALRQRSAAAAKAKKAEEAARQQKDKANIVAQYGQYDEISESESESATSVVEDWEIWGDPREVHLPLYMQSLPHCASPIQHPSHVNMSYICILLSASVWLSEGSLCSPALYLCALPPPTHTNGCLSGYHGLSHHNRLSSSLEDVATIQNLGRVQVERRRAERSRAAQLNMLSPEERQLQLAKELKTAMDSAKQVHNARIRFLSRCLLLLHAACAAMESSQYGVLSCRGNFVVGTC